MQELRIISIDGLKPPLKALAPEIEAYTGCKLRMVLHPETSIGLREQMMRGDVFDVALLTEHLLDEMIEGGKVLARSRVELCWCGLGVGVRAGTPWPDISTSDAVRHTLLNAKSVTYHATGATADRNHRLFEMLGITEQMKPKLKPDRDSRQIAQKKVADGEVELLLILSPEVNDAEYGVDLVGSLPTAMQPGCITFAGGVSANARHPDAADALLRFFATPAAAPTLDALGLYRGGSRPAW